MSEETDKSRAAIIADTIREVAYEGDLTDPERNCLTEIANEVQNLFGIFEHPNDTLPYCYLYKIEQAVGLLKIFSKYRSGGEHALGIAVQLEQFVKRAKEILEPKDKI